MKNLILIITIICTLSIKLSAQITADFTADKTEACNSIVTSFTNNSVPSSGVSYQWNFGNGQTSSIMNPTVAYTNPGSYTVELIVSNGTLSDTIIKADYIVVYAGPTAQMNLTGDATGCAPHTISFEDNSSPGESAVVNWHWDFGDGTVSSLQNPEHTFTYQSNFLTVLIVTDENNCSDIDSYTDLISVYKPKASFLADPINSCVMTQDINFFNNSTGIGNLTYTWNFGDETESNETHPVHFYEEPGIYDIGLIVYDEQTCSDTLIKPKYINLNGVNALFSINNTAVCLNEEIAPVNQSLNAVSYAWDFGDGTSSILKNPTHRYTIPGNYIISLSAYHTYGCIDIYTIPIIVEDVVADFEVSEKYACEVPASINYINTSQNAVSYQWAFGNGEVSTLQNPVITYTKAGIYNDTLYAFSANGCRAEKVIEKSVTIKIPSAYFSPNMFADPWSIKGCAPHSVDFLNKSSYDSEFDHITEYFWNFGDGTQSNLEDPTHTFYDVGSYLVSFYYTTDKGCTSKSYFAQAKVGTPQNADFIKTLPDTICASQGIQFFDKSQDSNLINEWYWQFGDDTYSMKQNPTHTYIDTGYMDVKLQAYYNGCGVAEEKTKFVYVKGPIVNITYDIDCKNPYDVILNSNNIDAEKIYWNFGDGSGIDSINYNPTHTYPENKQYTVNITAVNSSNSCSYSSNKVIAIKDIIANYSLNKTQGCVNLVAELNSESSQDEYFFYENGAYGRYHWDMGDGTKIVTSVPLLNYSYKHKGIFPLKLTVQDNRGCRDSMISQIQIFKPEPEFITENLIGCMPMEVDFTNSTKTDTTIISWAWNFGDETTSDIENPTHTYTQFGIYDIMLTATDAMGCVGALFKNDYIEALRPVPDFVVNDNTICIGESINFLPADKDLIQSYLWDFGDGNFSTDTFPEHTYENAGYYPVTLSLTDNQGCDSTLTISDYIYIQNYPVPEFMSSELSADCYPLQVIFSDTIDNPDVIDWFWNFGDGETSSHLKNPIHIYTRPGTYDVSLNLSTENGCISELTKDEYIDIKGPYALLNIPDTVCRNADALFIAENQKDIFDMQWIFGDGSTSDQDTITHSYDAVGYQRPVLLLRTDALGTCDVFISDSIYIPQLFTEIKSSNDIFADCVPFSFNPYNNTGDANKWEWDFGDGSFSNNEFPEHTYQTPGIYTVKLLISNNFGCSDSSDVLTETYSLPTITSLNDTLICVGDIIPLIANGAENYEWFPKLFLDDNYASQPNSQADSSITYTVFGTDSKGCINHSNLTVNVQQIPIVNIPDTAVIIGEEVILNAYSDDILTYNWNPDYEINCTDCPSIIVRPLEPTIYEITVSDINKCFTKSYDIFIDVLKKYTVDLPTAFTPNGDGINDLLYVNGWGVDELLVFRVFNRFGEIIFETSDKNVGWDGTYKGKLQNIEAYKYEVMIRTFEDEILSKTGTVKLLK